MDADTLLSLLQEQEENSAHFVWGTLAPERRESQKEYYRQPYGNEEEGWSSIVTSEVQDTVEWILPELLDMFVSSDNAVEFEPTQAADVKGAEQATDACNYVFYKQNNGFLILYTAFKDALMNKNCAVHWRKETIRKNVKVPVTGASLEMIALLMEKDDTIASANETQQPMIDAATGQPAIGADGQPIMNTLINAVISRPTEKRVIRVDAFEPNNLLVQRDWTSPLLDECPYVARIMEVSLSDLKQMGFKGVTASELAASTHPDMDDAADERTNRRGVADDQEFKNEVDSEDESLTKGYLRIEWVLVDFDGDGVAERREVYRLAETILRNEECEEVPIATGSPILVQHRWDGMSVAEIMSDLQMLKTELTRGVVNNASLASNPRKTVLTDANGAPYANIDDVLDFRPGGMVRQSRADSLGVDIVPFVGNQMLPLLEYVEGMGEKRTGVSRNSTGMDPNALQNDRTATEVALTNNAAKARIKLVARILAETVVKPTFRGILRLLIEGDMEPISMRLRGEFVQLDPNEWTDAYDMTTNVGTGTGDTEKQMAVLTQITALQAQVMATAAGPMFVTPQQVYNASAKRIQLAGFKNVGEYLTDPGPQAKFPTPPPPPQPQVEVAKINAQADLQKFQAQQMADAQQAELEDARKMRELQGNLELQAANDQRDGERQARKDEMDYQLAMAELQEKARKTDEDNRTKIIVAKIAHPTEETPDVDEEGNVMEKPDPLAPVMQALGALIDHAAAPKAIVRDETGKAVGVQTGDMVRQIVRDETGRTAGLQ